MNKDAWTKKLNETVVRRDEAGVLAKDRVPVAVPVQGGLHPIPYSPLPISFTKSVDPPKSGRTLHWSCDSCSSPEISSHHREGCTKKSVHKHHEIHHFPECFEFIHSQSLVMTQGSLVMPRPILFPVPVHRLCPCTIGRTKGIKWRLYSSRKTRSLICPWSVFGLSLVGPRSVLASIYMLMIEVYCITYYYLNNSHMSIKHNLSLTHQS